MQPDPICFYFTRLTVYDDGRYFPTEETFRDWFLSESVRLSEVREILDGYRELLGKDLYEEIQRPASKSADRRAFETGIYAAAAHFLEKEVGLSPSCLAFYSSGVTPVLLFTGIVSVHDYLRHILPFNERNREAYAEAGKRLKLAQVHFKGDPDDDVEGFLVTTIQERGLEGRVYLKDRRHHHTTMIGGLEADVLEVRKLACERFPAIARRAPVPRSDIVSAHLPFYDPQPLVGLLDGVQLSPPRHRIVGPVGEVIPAGCADQAVLRRLIVDSAMALLDTGQVVRTAARYASRLYVVGTRLGAGVLARTSIGGYPAAELATDVAGSLRRGSAHERSPEGVATGGSPGF
jgi:hypothetical protein